MAESQVVSTCAVSPLSLYGSTGVRWDSTERTRKEKKELHVLHLALVPSLKDVAQVVVEAKFEFTSLRSLFCVTSEVAPHSAKASHLQELRYKDIRRLAMDLVSQERPSLIERRFVNIVIGE